MGRVLIELTTIKVMRPGIFGGQVQKRKETINANIKELNRVNVFEGYKSFVPTSVMSVFVSLLMKD